MIVILFFGRMADIVATRRLERSLPEKGLSLFALRDEIFAEVMAARQLERGAVRMSVNQVVVRDDRALHDGDEIAFFSVFSGG